MNTTPTDKPLPCPFCGSQPYSARVGDDDGDRGYWCLDCASCGGKVGKPFCVVHADDEAQAVAIWNTRAARPADSADTRMLDHLDSQGINYGRDGGASSIRPCKVWTVRKSGHGGNIRDALRATLTDHPASADVAPAKLTDSEKQAVGDALRDAVAPAVQGIAKDDAPKRKRCMCCGAELTDDETLDHGCGMGFSTIVTPPASAAETPSLEQLAQETAEKIKTATNNTLRAALANRNDTTTKISIASFILTALQASRERDKEALAEKQREVDQARTTRREFQRLAMEKHERDKEEIEGLQIATSKINHEWNEQISQLRADLAKHGLELEAEVERLTTRYESLIKDYSEATAGETEMDELERLRVEVSALAATLRECPLLFTTTCNMAEKAWIEHARKLL